MLRHGIILVLFAVSLSSCTREKKAVSSETLRIGLASPIASFDPIHASDDPSTQVLHLFYQPLFLITQDGNAWPKTEANILKELPAIFDNGQAMRLQLKAGLRFPDSEALKIKAREATAKDLAITILRNSDRNLNAKYADVVENIEGVKEWWQGPKDLEKLPSGLKIENPNTLVVRFKNSAPNWWYNLSAINFSLVPAEAFGQQLALPVGTGNYQIKENTKEHLLLSKKDGAGPNNIEYRIYENRVEEGAELLKKNSLDILPISAGQATSWFDGTALKKEHQEAKRKTFYGATGQYVA